MLDSAPSLGLGDEEIAAFFVGNVLHRAHHAVDMIPILIVAVRIEQVRAPIDNLSSACPVLHIIADYFTWLQ